MTDDQKFRGVQKIPSNAHGSKNTTVWKHLSPEILDF